MLNMQMWGLLLGCKVTIDEGNRISHGVLTGVTKCPGDKNLFSLWVDYDYELYPEQCKPVLRRWNSITWEERELIAKKYCFDSKGTVDDFYDNLRKYGGDAPLFDLLDMGLDCFDWIDTGDADGSTK